MVFLAASFDLALSLSAVTSGHLVVTLWVTSVSLGVTAVWGRGQFLFFVGGLLFLGMTDFTFEGDHCFWQ